MTGLREALYDAARGGEPAPAFDIASALARGRRRRHRRIAAVATASTLGAAGIVIGAVALAGNGAGHSTVVTSSPAASPASGQRPLTVVTPQPQQSDGPPCGKVSRRMAQTAKQSLPNIGTWGPVQAAPGICDSDTYSFGVTVHIGTKVGWLSVVVTPTQRRQCPTSTFHGGTVSCKALPEGDIIAFDRMSMSTDGATPVMQSEVILMLNNGFTIDANALGGPDHWPAAGSTPNGDEPYTAEELTRLAVALAHTSQISGLQPAPFRTTS